MLKLVDHFSYGFVTLAKYGNVFVVRKVPQHQRDTYLNTIHTRRRILINQSMT